MSNPALATMQRRSLALVLTGLAIGLYTRHSNACLFWIHVFKYCAKGIQPSSTQISAGPLLSFSVNASLSTWARLVSRWGTPAGSSTAWNMVSSQTARCRARRLLEATMTPSQPSSVRPGLGSMFPGPSLLTWNPPSLVWIIMLANFLFIIRYFLMIFFLIEQWVNYFSIVQNSSMEILFKPRPHI